MNTSVSHISSSSLLSAVLHVLRLSILLLPVWLLFISFLLPLSLHPSVYISPSLSLSPQFVHPLFLLINHTGVKKNHSLAVARQRNWLTISPQRSTHPIIIATVASCDHSGVSVCACVCAPLHASSWPVRTLRISDTQICLTSRDGA